MASGFYSTEPLFDDWPSMFCLMWVPDRATAYRAGERETRYVVTLACWGEPSHVFESALADIQDLATSFVESWEWVSSATARWDAADQRIVIDFLCVEEEPGFPDSTAEVMADYVDRSIVATVEGWTSGQTAIVDVFVPD